MRYGDGEMKIKMCTLGKWKCKCCCFWCFLQRVAPYFVIGALMVIALQKMEHKSIEDTVSGTSMSNVVRKINIRCDIELKAYE